jgi:predicted nucleic acid-binding protein
MYTIDASVWINSFDEREDGHEISGQVLDLLIAQEVAIILPNLAFIEIASAIRRRHGSGEVAERFTNAIRTLPSLTAIPLDEALERQATTIAIQQALRGADAVYAAVAVQFECTLISLDNEHLTRLAGIVEARTPADLLAELTTEQQPEID